MRVPACACLCTEVPRTDRPQTRPSGGAGTSSLSDDHFAVVRETKEQTVLKVKYVGSHIGKMPHGNSESVTQRKTKGEINF